MNLESTTAGGRPWSPPAAPSVLVIGGALEESSTTYDPKLRFESRVRLARATGSGGVILPVPTSDTEPQLNPREAVGELRRLSGLTWAQLADLFGVSRRAVHFWASGKALKPTHAEHLRKVLDTIRAGVRSSARATREALLEAESGDSVFALLRQRRFAEATAKLGRTSHKPRPRGAPLSPKSKAERTPLPPEQLLDAIQEPAHRHPTRVRAGRSVRVKSGGTAG